MILSRFLFLRFFMALLLTLAGWYASRSWDLVCAFPNLYLDKPLHIAGGVSVAFFSLWFFEEFFWIFRSRPFSYFKDTFVGRRVDRKSSFQIALLSSFVVGVLWEIMQHYISWFTQCNLEPHEFLNFDTPTDVIADVCGGYIAYFITRGKVSVEK